MPRRLNYWKYDRIGYTHGRGSRSRAFRSDRALDDLLARMQQHTGKENLSRFYRWAIDKGARELLAKPGVEANRMLDEMYRVVDDARGEEKLLSLARLVCEQWELVRASGPGGVPTANELAVAIGSIAKGGLPPAPKLVREGVGIPDARLLDLPGTTTPLPGGFEEHLLRDAARVQRRRERLKSPRPWRPGPMPAGMPPVVPEPAPPPPPVPVVTHEQAWAAVEEAGKTHHTSIHQGTQQYASTTSTVPDPKPLGRPRKALTEAPAEAPAAFPAPAAAPVPAAAPMRPPPLPMPFPLPSPTTLPMPSLPMPSASFPPSLETATEATAPPSPPPPSRPRPGSVEALRASLPALLKMSEAEREARVRAAFPPASECHGAIPIEDYPEGWFEKDEQVPPPGYEEWAKKQDELLEKELARRRREERHG